MGTLARQNPPSGPSTVEDFLKIPQRERFHELIDGEIVQRALPVWRHQRVQKALLLGLASYDRKAVRGRRGGWYIQSDVEVRFDRSNVLRPDLAGWRRASLPSDFDVDALLTVRPDWACEIVSESNRANDLVTKVNKYARYGIPHYWIVEPKRQTLTVLRLNGDIYVEASRWTADEIAQAEPFHDTDISLTKLFAVSN